MEIIVGRFLHFTGLEVGLIFLTGSVLLSLTIMIAYFRRVMGLLGGSGPAYSRPDQVRKWVEESEIVYEKLLKTLEERKEIANRLIAQLDLKIETLRSLMAGIDREAIPIAEEVSVKEEEVEVVKMAEEGRAFSEISKQTGLSIGEVQFIMNLRRYQESSPLKIA